MSDQRGFTLVELLVAMAAASLLFLGLAQVNAGLAHRLAVSSPTDRAVEVARGGRALSQLVAFGIPTVDAADLHLSETQVQFPLRINGRGNLFALLSVEQGRDGETLRVQLIDRGGEIIADSDEQLLPPMRSIRLEADGGTSVSNVPFSTERRLKALTVHFVDNNGQSHALAATGRISAPPGCRFDPISLSCRPD